MENIANFLDVPNLTLKAAVEALAKRVDAMSEENLADLDRRLQNVIKAIDEARKKKSAAAEVCHGSIAVHSGTVVWSWSSPPLPPISTGMISFTVGFQRDCSQGERAA